MAQAIIDTLTPYCTAPPPDLVEHFAKATYPVDRELAINILPLAAALKYTSGIRSVAILGTPFGLIALEDGNNSNPYCYITNGPTRGAIMHLCHGGESGVAFASLADFLTAINDAIGTRTYIEDLKPDQQLSALNRESITQYVAGIAGSDDDVEELCVLIPLISTTEVDLVARIAGHPDFFAREAVARHIAKHPIEALQPVAKQLAEDPHPQVAGPGKRALSAINRAKQARPPQ